MKKNPTHTFYKLQLISSVYIPKSDAAVQADLTGWRTELTGTLLSSKVLHLVRNDRRHQHMLEIIQLESRSAENNTGVLMDNKLNMSHQRSLAAKKKG